MPLVQRPSVLVTSRRRTVRRLAGRVGLPAIPHNSILARKSLLPLVDEPGLLIANSEQRSEEEIEFPRACPLLRSLQEKACPFRRHTGDSGKLVTDGSRLTL